MSGNPSGLHRTVEQEPAQEPGQEPVEYTRVDGGWASNLSGIGHEAYDRRMSHRHCTRRLPYGEIVDLWNHDDLAAKAIEKPGAEAFREGYELDIASEGDYDDLKEQIEEKLLELDVDCQIERAYAMKRALGGSAILLGTDDNRPMSEPLQMDRVRSLDWINVLEPIELQPVQLYDDPAAPKYGKPEYFMVGTVQQARGFGALGKAKPSKIKPASLIHESRLIVFQGISASRYYLPASDDVSPWWGASIMHRFVEEVRDFNVAYESAALIASDVGQPVITIDGLMHKVAKDKAAVHDRMAALNMGRSTARAILLDAKEKFERQATQLAGYGELLDRIDKRTAVAVDQPLSIMLGYNPATMGAPSESELKQWFNFVRAIQRRELTPPLRRIVGMIMRQLRQRKLPQKWRLRWHELERLNLKELVESRYTQSKTDGEYTKMGGIWSDEIRRSRFHGGYSFETQIDQKKKAPGFIAPLPAGVLPKAIPASGVIQAKEAGESAGVQAGAAAAQPAAGLGAHKVTTYVRRNPAAQAPASRRDAGDYTAAAELADARSQLERARETGASGAVQALLEQLVAVTEREAQQCADGTCGPDCLYDHPA